MRIVGPILLHFFNKKLQVMDMLFEETDCLCFAFFIRKLQVMDVLFQETGWLCSPGRIACYYIFSSRNCRGWTCSSRRQTGFAPPGLSLFHWESCILLHFIINNFQVMDMLFEETDWLCSPGTSFSPLGLDGAHRQTDRQIEPQTWQLLDQLGPVGPSW